MRISPPDNLQSKASLELTENEMGLPDLDSPTEKRLQGQWFDVQRCVVNPFLVWLSMPAVMDGDDAAVKCDV